jgi:hypothetical protein
MSMQPAFFFEEPQDYIASAYLQQEARRQAFFPYQCTQSPATFEICLFPLGLFYIGHLPYSKAP